MNSDSFRVFHAGAMMAGVAATTTVAKADAMAESKPADRFSSIREADDSACITPPQPVAEGVEASIAGVTIRVYKTIPNKWSHNLERKFDDLAVKEALGEITPKEQARLRELLYLRRTLHTPLSGDEARRIYLHAEKLQRLRAALTDYVEFTEASAHA